MSCLIKIYCHVETYYSTEVLCFSVYFAFLHFDVLSNSYISALSDDEKQPSLQNAISSGWPASLHLIGKVMFIHHLQ